MHILSAVPTLKLLSMLKLNGTLTTWKSFSIIKTSVYRTLSMQQALAKHRI